MIKRQGEDIDFNIEVINQDGSIGDMSRYSNVTVKAKAGCYAIVFSLVETEGYYTLTVIDNILYGVISGVETVKMKGDLEFELTTIENGNIEAMPIENSGIKII